MSIAPDVLDVVEQFIEDRRRLEKEHPPAERSGWKRFVHPFVSGGSAMSVLVYLDEKLKEWDCLESAASMSALSGRRYRDDSPSTVTWLASLVELCTFIVSVGLFCRQQTSVRGAPAFVPTLFSENSVGAWASLFPRVSSILESTASGILREYNESNKLAVSDKEVNVSDTNAKLDTAAVAEKGTEHAEEDKERRQPAVLCESPAWILRGFAQLRGVVTAEMFLYVSARSLPEFYRAVTTISEGKTNDDAAPAADKES